MALRQKSVFSTMMPCVFVNFCYLFLPNERKTATKRFFRGRTSTSSITGSSSTSSLAEIKNPSRIGSDFKLPPGFFKHILMDQRIILGESQVFIHPTINIRKQHTSMLLGLFWTRHVFKNICRKPYETLWKLSAGGLLLPFFTISFPLTIHQDFSS